MNQSIARREFLAQASVAATGLVLSTGLPTGLPTGLLAADKKKKLLYKISLTQYSLHRTIASEKLKNIDFTSFTRKEFDIDAVEYWNRPFFAKAKDKAYIGQMRKRADDVGVGATVILIDGEGNLGDPDLAKRKDSVERHKKWVEAAKQLGCHSIRVNARSKGTYEEQLKLAADGLRRLSEFAATIKMNVIVENHGGHSSNGKWLSSVMKTVDLKNCGTLPDFGNFRQYDRYLGVRELMPFAKSVSAKSHAFDEAGNETATDFLKMMKIVVDAGYDDYVGIEYEGKKLPEVAGVHATKKLLVKVRGLLS